jgi:hypothetical protein
MYTPTVRIYILYIPTYKYDDGRVYGYVVVVVVIERHSDKTDAPRPITSGVCMRVSVCIRVHICVIRPVRTEQHGTPITRLFFL